MILLPSQEIFFSSVLNQCYYDELEKMMFFNPQQSKLRKTVSQLVEHYGNPKIIEEQNRLRIQLGSSMIAQTLYSFNRFIDGDLIGVVVYIREFREQLSIIHLAVKEDYSLSGCHADQHLVLCLIQKVQEIGARLKGVETIEILYNQSLKKIPVRHLDFGF